MPAAPAGWGALLHAGARGAPVPCATMGPTQRSSSAMAVSGAIMHFPQRRWRPCVIAPHVSASAHIPLAQAPHLGATPPGVPTPADTCRQRAAPVEEFPQHRLRLDAGYLQCRVARGAWGVGGLIAPLGHTPTAVWSQAPVRCVAWGSASCAHPGLVVAAPAGPAAIKLKRAPE